MWDLELDFTTAEGSGSLVWEEDIGKLHLAYVRHFVVA